MKDVATPIVTTNQKRSEDNTVCRIIFTSNHNDTRRMPAALRVRPQASKEKNLQQYLPCLVQWMINRVGTKRDDLRRRGLYLYDLESWTKQ
jgi:hypothetical protein